MPVQKSICPECKQLAGVDIVYGDVGEEAQEQAKRGEIALYGCFIGLDSPQFHCTNCQNSWGRSPLLDPPRQTTLSRLYSQRTDDDPKSTVRDHFFGDTGPRTQVLDSAEFLAKYPPAHLLARKDKE